MSTPLPPPDLAPDALLAVVSAGPVGICLLDGRDFRGRWCNAAFRQLLPAAARAGDVAARPAEELVPRFVEDQLAAAFRGVATSGRPFVVPEYECRTVPDGPPPHDQPSHGQPSLGQGPPGDGAAAVTYWRWTVSPVPPAGRPAGLAAVAGGASGGEAPSAAGPDLMIHAVDVTEPVTARRAAEGLAGRAEAALVQLEAIINSIDEGVMVADTAGNLLHMNPAARRIHGYAPGEDVRRHMSGFTAVFEIRDPADGRPLPPTDWPLARAVRGESFTGVELLVRRIDQDRSYIGNYSGTPVRLRDGRVAAIIIGLRDVTAQKRGEQELERARRQAEQANATKDQFLAVLSHELRTPLTPVLTAAQMMQQDPALPPGVRETAGMIRRNVELEARLIDDLLDLTRVSRGKLRLEMTRADVHDKIRNVVQILDSDMRAKGVRLDLVLAADRRHIRGDPARLQQVVWNLLKNAIKFTPAGGRVTIATRDEADPRHDAAAAAGGPVAAGTDDALTTPPGSDRHLVLEVTDTGIGIERHVLPKIFDAFQQGSREVTRAFGGLGLGLAVTRALVQLHGGVIEAASDGPGRGAQFTVRLPALPAGPNRPAGAAAGGEPAAGHAGEAAAPPARGRRILLVEDHDDTAAVMSMVLRHQGHQVRTADSVATALQAADAEPFDLLISDIGLPDGSGLDLMRQLQARRGGGPPVKGIALSGFGMEEDVRKSRAAGFDEHLTKPVSLDALDVVIGRVVGA
jgi:signal transduction histidine kinase/CheY-like chemotaxis protein